MQIANERRQFGRRTTNINAWIAVPGKSTLPCRIVNLTQKGAMLELEPPDWLPFNFKVLLEGNSEAISCEIRHIVQNGVGVNFRLDLREDDAPISPPGRVEEQQWIGLAKPICCPKSGAIVRKR